MARALGRSSCSTTGVSRSPTSPATTMPPPGAGEALTEGDHRLTSGRSMAPPPPRSSAIRPTAVAAARKVSMRSTDGRVDVSAIARKPRAAAGTGAPPVRHRPAATKQLVEFLMRRDRLSARDLATVAQTEPTAGPGPAGRQAGRCHLPRCRGRDQPRARRRRSGHAGTLDPFATGLLMILLGAGNPDAALSARAAQDIRGDRAARLALSTGDPDGRARGDGEVPKRLELPTGEIEQRVPMTSAVKVDGERLYKKAHRGEIVETPDPRGQGASRRAARQRRRARRPSRSSARRAPTSARWSRRSRMPTARALRRTAIGATGGARRRAGRDPGRGADVVPAGACCWTKARRRQSATDARSPSRSTCRREHVRLTHDGRLIAVARPDGENLRPEVVLRMSIKVTNLPDATPRDRHVAIGVFDGVHKGHQAVIDEADTVLTFDPHPLSA